MSIKNYYRLNYMVLYNCVFIIIFKIIMLILYFRILILFVLNKLILISFVIWRIMIRELRVRKNFFVLLELWSYFSFELFFIGL